MKRQIPVHIGQQILAKAGFYKYKIDGEFGPKTRAACLAVTFDGPHLLTRAAQTILANAGHPKLKVDGAYGPMTEAAYEVYCQVPTWRDGGSKWPRYSELRQFYGAPGVHHVKLLLPYKMRIAWDTSTIVRQITVHRKCRDAFEQIFEGALAYYGLDGIHELGLNMFGGCYNNRSMRGSSRLSTHAYACSIDLDPARNRLRWDSSRARLAKDDAVPFWEIVEETKMVSLGRKKDYDWMHFQGCQ